MQAKFVSQEAEKKKKYEIALDAAIGGSGFYIYPPARSMNCIEL